MKPEPTLSVDTMMKAKLEYIIRLANYIGIDIDRYKGKSDEKWRIVTAIARWYKLNPQKSKKNIIKIKDYRCCAG